MNSAGSIATSQRTGSEITLIIQVPEAFDSSMPLIPSISAQDFPQENIHLVFVRNGCTDDQWHFLQATVSRQTTANITYLDSESVTYLDAARNANVESWLSFPDLHDVLPTAYLRVITKQLAKNREISAAYVWIQRQNPQTHKVTPTHPLDYQFVNSGIYDLKSDPDRFPGVAKSIFFKTAEFLESVNSDLLIQDPLAQFSLIIDYFNEPKTRMISQINETYLIETNNSNSVPYGINIFKSENYFTTYLSQNILTTLIDTSQEGRTRDEWIESLALFYLTWYFRPDETLSTQMNAEMHHTADEFHEIIAQILAQLRPATFDSLPVRLVPPVRYLTFKYGYPSRQWHDENLRITDRDRSKQLIQVSYYYAGSAPIEEIRLAGNIIDAKHSKHREIAYAGRTLLFERIIWVPDTSRIEILLNGERTMLGPATSRRYVPWLSDITYQRIVPSPKKRTPTIDKIKTVVKKLASPRWWFGKLQRKIAFSSHYRKKYKKSWMLLDRVDQANDNAEHLMRYLITSMPNQNAFFALAKNSSDWTRLRKEFGSRLVKYGSLRWRIICLNSELVLSSQAGPYVYNPVPIRHLGSLSWQFIFLQHGVIGTDLSRWLNQRRFSLFVTTTPDEYGSLAGNGSRYRITTKEVVMTGLPRHDRLVRLDREMAPEKRSRIVIAPTWREYLLGEKNPKDGTRSLLSDFNSTVFAQAWRGLLTSPQLTALAARSNATIAFMPHPNLQPYLKSLDLPESIEILSYSENNIQDVLVSSKLVITDLSSLVFDAALIRRPIIYYQFDQNEIFGGGHTVRQGYFSYEDNGFGPVCLTLDEVLHAVAMIADNGFNALPPYSERIESTFAFRDESACERVVASIQELQASPNDVDLLIPVQTPIAPRPSRIPKPRTHS